jgi:hypothetical protein
VLSFAKFEQFHTVNSTHVNVEREKQLMLSMLNLLSIPLPSKKSFLPNYMSVFILMPVFKIDKDVP